MSQRARTVEYSTPAVMNKVFRTLQLNVRKQSTVYHSLMNNAELQDFAVLMIQEPPA
jgi:hypothetical protein